MTGNMLYKCLIVLCAISSMKASEDDVMFGTETMNSQGHAQVVQNLTEKAVAFHHAIEIMDEYTVNWTLVRSDAMNDKPRQMKLMSGSDWYQDTDQSHVFSTGVPKQNIKELIRESPTSAEFKSNFDQALENCEYFIDEELRYVDKEFKFYRFGFMRQLPNLDKYTTVLSRLSTKVDKIGPKTDAFLKCAAVYERSSDPTPTVPPVEKEEPEKEDTDDNDDELHENKTTPFKTAHASPVKTKSLSEGGGGACQLPPQLSKYDWIGFKIFYRALATTGFMEDNKSRRNSLHAQYNRYYKAHLPRDYRPMAKCPRWPPANGDCRDVRNPKFSAVIGVAQTWNVKGEVITGNDQRSKVNGIDQSLLLTATPVVVRCNLAAAALADQSKLFSRWVEKELVDRDFTQRLAEAVTARLSRDSYFLRDLYFISSPKTLQFARIALVRDQSADRYHVIGLFSTFKSLKPLTTGSKVNDCPVDQVTCEYVKFKTASPTYDQQLKQDLMNKAIQKFKSVK